MPFAPACLTSGTSFGLSAIFQAVICFVAILLVMLLIVPYIFPKRETAFLLSGGWLFLLTGCIQLGFHVQPDAFIDAVLVYLFRFDSGRLETDSVFFAGYTAYFRESLFYYLLSLAMLFPEHQCPVSGMPWTVHGHRAMRRLSGKNGTLVLCVQIYGISF